MPTAAQTVNKKWAKGSVETFGRWLGGLDDPKPQATAINKKVDGLIRAARGGKKNIQLWELQVDGLARDLLGKKARVIPQGISIEVKSGGRSRTSHTVRVNRSKGETLLNIASALGGGKPLKIDQKPAGAARPPALFPAKKNRPKPWQVEPDRKVASAGVQAGAKIKRIPMLEGLPAKMGGPAWKKFFKKHAGRDLDDPSNIRVLPDLGPGAGFRPGERLEGPKGSGWTMVYFVTDAGSGELALHAHALQNDSYVASWYTVIAPREPLEKDEMALKMVTASAIEGARRALTTIARQYGTKLPAAASSFTPTPRAYHAQIAKKHGADLRGSPLYAEVNWSRKALVNPNDDFFGSLA